MIILPKNFFKLIFTFLVWGISFTLSSGQKILKADQFILDPTIITAEDVFSLSVKDKGIIYLGKTSVERNGGYSYTLELRRPDLEVVWTNNFKVSPQENFINLKLIDSSIALFSVIHDEKLKQSQLQVTIYNLESGELEQERILSENTVQPWQEEYDKGGLKLTYENLILSGLKKDLTTPLEYRHQVSFSPNNKKLLIYYFNFSQPELYAETKIFNEKWEEERKISLPINKGYLNSGIFINNSGKIYLLNTKTDGTIAVIKVDPEDGQSDFLEISPSNSLRNSFKFDFEDNDHVIVSNLSYRNSRLSGLMFSRFNFNEKKIDWVTYQEISSALQKDTTNILKIELVNKNFELVDFYNLADSRTFIIENRDYFAPGQALDLFGMDHKSLWKPRKGKIATGELAIINFNKDQELNWIQVVKKNQSNSSEEGLTSISYNAEIVDQDLKIIFAEGVGNISKLNHVRINLPNGQLKIDELPNQHNLVLIRKLTHWINDNTLLLTGKKGIKSNSSLIIKYSF